MTDEIQLTPPCVLLENRLDAEAPAVLFSDIADVVYCDSLASLDGTLRRLEQGLADGLHAAGVLFYELGHAMEPRLQAGLSCPTPLIHMGLFRTRFQLHPAQLDAFFARRGAPSPATVSRFGHDRATHVDKVRRLQALIAAGDIYQANLTFPIDITYDGDALQLYAAMRVRQPTAHGAFVSLGEDWLLSVSPELFLSVRDGCIESRPMKGTIPRAADPVLDAQAATALRLDPKQRAENIMIVDLMRNDLSRVALTGSVRVPALLTVETYPDLHTMTSTVTARLRPQVGITELLRAAFPCGSIVGAPKIRAMQVLRDLEEGRRGAYTGAIGAISPNGDVDLNVAIRTLHLRADGTGRYGVGGGIVADSDPHGEYDEALLKGRLLQDLTRDFQLIETFRWSGKAGYLRLAGHLDRLQQSARDLDFAFDRSAAETLLDLHAQEWAADAGRDRRVRLLLERAGDLSLGHSEMDPPADDPVRLVVATARLDQGSPYLRHKTTRRDVFDAAAAEAAAAGADEAVILNRAGRVADASRQTVFVEVEGRLFTPPLDDGALPGVLRAELLRGGSAAERSLRIEDLLEARTLLVGNSLHGLRRAVLQA